MSKTLYICADIDDPSFTDDDACIGLTLLDSYMAYCDRFQEYPIDFEKLTFYKATPIKVSINIKEVQNEIG